MPYSEKQNRLFRAIAHGWKPDDPDIKISRADAAKMAAEGVKGKKHESPQKRALRDMMKD